MGYCLHRVIIVDGFNVEHVCDAQEAANGIFASHGLHGLVTGVHRHAINGNATFMIVPDGSKEGWEESDKGDKARNEFIEWLKKMRKRSFWLSWVEVVVHDDDGEPRVERHLERGDEE